MYAFLQMQSTFLIRTLGDRKKIRITKGSNYRDSNRRGFLSGDFQGPENFAPTRKSSNYTSSN